MKAVNEVMEARLKCLKDTLNMTEPEKIPVNIQTTTGNYAYAGTTQRAVLNDPIKNANAYVKIFEDLKPDVCSFGVNTMPVGIYEALGLDRYYLGPDETSVVHKQSGECYYGAEFYDWFNGNNTAQVLADIREDLMRKYVPALRGTKEEAVEGFKAAIEASKRELEYKRLTVKRLDDLGIVRIVEGATRSVDAPGFNSPYNKVFDIYRGIKEALIDLRRRPDAVKALCDSIFEVNSAMFKKDADEIKKDLKDLIIPMSVNITHVETFLPRKMFGPLYIDYMKKSLAPYFEAGVKYFIYLQGSFKRNIDLYMDLPKQSLFFQIDDDDPFEIYDIIGKYHTICCGANIVRLKTGTKEDNINYAKKCIDTFAPGGGFVFMHDKALTCASDINIENLRAVYDFANEYGRK